MNRRWRAWRCHRGHHRWQNTHPAIWGGAYVTCRDCGRRDVHGIDTYGPAASQWKASGRIPPRAWPALAWDAADWAAWADAETTTDDPHDDDGNRLTPEWHPLPWDLWINRPMNGDGDLSQPRGST